MRDPKRVFARYGRQLLVQGVDFDGQARLHGWSAVLGADTSVAAQAATEACGRYLVGAGVGAVLAPSAWAASLQALDPQLVLLTQFARVPEPSAHFWFSWQPDGARVELQCCDATSDEPTRTATVYWDVAAPADDTHAVALGAAAAELLLADVLGVAPLPAVVRFDWRDPAAPTLTRHARAAGAQDERLLDELRADAVARSTLETVATQGYPNETCGIVVRQQDARLRVVVCENLQDRYHAADPETFPRTARTAYKMDERVLVRAAQAGETVVAIWHSHCDCGAYFSAEDARCAAPAGEPLFPGVRYLVLSVVDRVLADVALFDVGAAGGVCVAKPAADSAAGALYTLDAWGMIGAASTRTAP